MTTETDRLPFDGLRVIDMTDARSGPVAVRHFTDWGADVIRIESVGREAMGDRDSSDMQNLHRGKRSIGIDMKSKVGVETLHRLIAEADIFVENMRPSAKYRLGVGYEELSKINPRLIYGSISGYGQTGPRADLGCVDQIMQGYGGIMSLTGEVDGDPMRVGVAISDVTAGLCLTVGILTALHERERSGKGQWVQTSLLEAIVTMLDFQGVTWTADHSVPARQGNGHPLAPLMNCYATADGFINLAGSWGRMWTETCRVLGVPELTEDPRFDTMENRLKNRDDLEDIVVPILKTRPSAEWLPEFEAGGVPAGPVHTVDQVFEDEQVQHLGMIRRVEHPTRGPIDLVRSPVTFSRSSDDVCRPAPARGDHTDEILAEFKFTPEEIASLRAAEVVA